MFLKFCLCILFWYSTVALDKTYSPPHPQRRQMKFIVRSSRQNSNHLLLPLILNRLKDWLALPPTLLSNFWQEMVHIPEYFPQMLLLDWINTRNRWWAGDRSSTPFLVENVEQVVVSKTRSVIIFFSQASLVGWLWQPFPAAECCCQMELRKLLLTAHKTLSKLPFFLWAFCFCKMKNLIQSTALPYFL